MRKINLLGNLHTPGGGEQSLCTLAKCLQAAGWEVVLYPWKGVHQNYVGLGLPIREGPEMEPNLPLLFYANDRMGLFCAEESPWREAVENCSDLLVGVNYVNRPLPTCKWIRDTGRLRAVIFQNREKRDEFDRDAKDLLPETARIVLHGVVDLDPFLAAPVLERVEGEPLVVLKHCTADGRKFVTQSSRGKGEKVHVWQKHLDKELDVKLYRRLLKDVPNVRFEFMAAHGELKEEFREEPNVRCYKWDEMPVVDFLAGGHVYLYRTSNAWRDQYPRVVAEALAAGLPVLTEPRDGTRDRVQHGDTGFYCVDYDGWRYALRLLARKERLRRAMGRAAREWAQRNLDPMNWVRVIEGVLL